MFSEILLLWQVKKDTQEKRQQEREKEKTRKQQEKELKQREREEKKREQEGKKREQEREKQKKRLLAESRKAAKPGECLKVKGNVFVSTCFCCYFGEVKNPNMFLKCNLFYSKSSLNIHYELSTHCIKYPHQR